ADTSWPSRRKRYKLRRVGPRRGDTGEFDSLCFSDVHRHGDAPASVGINDKVPAPWSEFCGNHNVHVLDTAVGITAERPTGAADDRLALHAVLRKQDPDGLTILQA